ncbi:tyrosine-type recombinase/integrase [Bradyrhizobium sp. 200]|uniref:tyrosine-type recombinase/integrase n=1 Tax=Bradyrhizobium sp. 200 TaxID=2782665 RepID=UPI001FFFBCB5|nr:tyrosine-type recombinase/integrase [Bradyrhizobium sp. 200]UPJ53412.1 tyrosine-type recombinase/integrase [Bradyrhizobium sp. 200]
MGPRIDPPPFMPGRGDWLASLRAAGKSPITVDCYARDLNQIASAVEGDCTSHVRIAEFDQSTIQTLAAGWETAGISRSTVLRRFSSLRAFASFLCRQGVGCGLVLASRLPRPIRSPRVTLDDEDVNALTGPVPDQSSSPIAIRTRSIVIVKAETGLTTGEIANLDVIDVDLERQTIKVVRTHLEPRVLRISPQASLALATYLEKVRGISPGALFLSLRGTRLCARSIQLMFGRLRRQRGVREDATLRSLRHTLGAGFANNGEPISVVAEWLGLAVGSAARYFGPEGRRS